jgi:Tfp pilus assembly protein PilF
MNFVKLSILSLLCLCYSQFSLSDDNVEGIKRLEIKEDLKKPAKMQDLAYGNILYEYYRGKPLKALNEILIAEKKGLLPNHQESARLLSGVIYLDLGMLSHAQKIFSELLSEESLKNELLARLEFYLGKLHYRQGDYSQAKIKLEKVVAVLNTTLKDEGLIMLSNIAISMDQKALARSWLMKISKNSKLAEFSRYNLGVSWLREGDLVNAKPFLSDIPLDRNSEQSEILADDEQLIIKSIKDKAKVALGYYYLAHKDYKNAREQFLRVRLDSLQTNKALLGIGWSYLETDQYNKALSHWMELSSRDVRDIAVQEVLLAVPYALQKLGSQQEALNAYLKASDSYQKQITLIDKLILQIEQGRLLESTVTRMLLIQDNDLSSENLNDDGIKDSNLFGDEFDYYLFELISEHQFNEGFRSYQKLGVLSGVLQYWEQQLPVFNEILKANKISFNKKIPLVDSYLTEGAFEKYENELLKLETDIADLKTNKRMSLLANKEQLAIYKRISSLMSKIQNIPSSMISDEQREQAKRAKGVLQWQLESFKVEKIWTIEKQAKAIRDIINEMNLRKTSLASARNKAGIRFSGFQEKVDEGTSQLVGLRDKIKFQITIQVDSLKTQIINLLNDRKKSLDYFLLQSDLAIARMHGQAVVIPELN